MNEEIFAGIFHGDLRKDYGDVELRAYLPEVAGGTPGCGVQQTSLLGKKST
jgi:hypothetical protein